MKRRNVALLISWVKKLKFLNISVIFYNKIVTIGFSFSFKLLIFI